MRKKKIAILSNYESHPHHSFTTQHNYGLNGIVKFTKDINVTTKILCTQNFESELELDKTLNKFDALIISGGSDIDPSFYSPHSAEQKSETSYEDYLQIFAAKKFLKNKRKMFGICRGMQIINVAAGGTLIQDIPNHRNHAHSYGQERFVNTPIIASTPFMAWLGDGACAHHQSVKQLGKDLIVTATSKDNIIEGIRNVENTTIGVQYHPEAERTFMKQIPQIINYLVTDM